MGIRSMSIAATAALTLALAIGSAHAGENMSLAMMGVTPRADVVRPVLKVSEECQAGCEIRYKKCMKSADGDVDRSLDCSDAKDQCIQNCG